MKKLLSLLRNVSKKRLIPVLALVAAAAVPAAIVAWGPSRATFTVDHPADHITFNSITDNPNVGDERNFVSVRDASITTDGGWQDNVTAVAGKEYTIRVYVHNNAASSLNLKATNTRVKVGLPSNTAKSLDFTGYVSADNANPGQVWDDAGLTSSSDFNIAYVPGSAWIYNNATGPNGRQLSDSIVTSAGAPVGYDKNDGVVPGCFQYASYVVLKVKVQGPQSANFNMNKYVSKHGANQWVKDYAAQPGETVDYLVQYRNTGEVQQDNVIFQDTLPAGESYVAGSAILGNSANPNGIKTNDGITTTGLNVGSYAPNGNAWFIFSAKVADNDHLPTCGPNKIHNVASVETDYGKKTDSADVDVTKTCKPPEASYVCTGLEVNPITRTQFSFKAGADIKNADFVKFTYIVRDQDGHQVASLDGARDQSVLFTRTQTGKYTVEAVLTVRVNGQEKTAPVGDCKKPFEVTEQPVTPVYTCDSLQLVKKVSRDTFTFKVTPKTAGDVSVKEYTFDFGDMQTATVGAGQETQTHTYAAPGNYTAKVAITFMVRGETVPGITSATCQVPVTVESVPTPPSTPTTPTELPSTGPVEAAAGLIGTSSLGLGVHAFINSRRAMRDAMKR